MSTYVLSDELYHHGVLGMKWGVRRYQPYSIGYDAMHNGRFLGLPRPDSKAGQAREARKTAARVLRSERREAARIDKTKKKDAKTRYANAKKASDEKLKADLKNTKGIRNRFKLKTDHDVNQIMSDARYKASKAKNSKRAARKERKTYVNAMGNVGIDNPFTLHKQPRNLATSIKLYKKLRAQKGAAYANSVLRSTLMRKAVGIGAGAAFGAYLKTAGGQYITSLGKNVGQQYLNKYGNKLLDAAEMLYKKKQQRMGG